MKKLILLILTIFVVRYADIHAMQSDTIIDMSQITQEPQTQSSTAIPGSIPDTVINMRDITQETPSCTFLARSLGNTELTPRTREITGTIKQGGDCILEKVGQGEQQILKTAKETHDTLNQMNESLQKMMQAQEEQRRIQNKQWIANRFSLGVTFLGACSLITNFVMQRLQ
ncbi:hypothetical protein [Methylicorpusculum sp.]|uniref:hypothetical protein n=1 Tax=Methylicorpusculum sp. TaxID=2713644 RepID=UPI002AB98027|nr:hypothetical protein [Methylicorpusculum sp.]MDZ4152944.1 hypothetical protein [Methylicorpusculum sp.]